MMLCVVLIVSVGSNVVSGVLGVIGELVGLVWCMVNIGVLVLCVWLINWLMLVSMCLLLCGWLGLWNSLICMLMMSSVCFGEGVLDIVFFLSGWCGWRNDEILFGIGGVCGNWVVMILCVFVVWVCWRWLCVWLLKGWLWCGVWVDDVWCVCVMLMMLCVVYCLLFNLVFFWFFCLWNGL